MKLTSITILYLIVLFFPFHISAQDSTDTDEVQIFLADWQHAEITQVTGDTFRYYKLLADRAWRVLSLWIFTSDSTPLFSVDVTMDYIPALGDGDDWDQVYVAGGTQLFDVFNLGTMKARRLAWIVSGIVPGKLVGIRFKFNNWVTV